MVGHGGGRAAITGGGSPRGAASITTAPTPSARRASLGRGLCWRPIESGVSPASRAGPARLAHRYEASRSAIPDVRYRHGALRHDREQNSDLKLSLRRTDTWAKNVIQVNPGSARSVKCRNVLFDGASSNGVLRIPISHSDQRVNRRAIRAKASDGHRRLRGYSSSIA
jgi:hypothetical protein